MSSHSRHPLPPRITSRDAGCTILCLYISPDFATAFMETVVRDRFTRRRNRDIELKELAGRVQARITGAAPGRRGRVCHVRSWRPQAGCH